MKKLIPLFLVLVLLLSGCISDIPPEESPVIPSTSATPTPEEPTPTPEPIRNPLTGEVMDKDPGNLRPYAVMINNYKAALPHMGISQADIIYEVLAEGEITRMMAIFSDITGIEKIGSMRSARPYYIEIARSFDAIYVHAGGSDQAYYDISAKGVNNIDGVRGAYGGEIFFRDPARQDRAYEHRLITTSDLIAEYLPKFNYRTEHETEDFDYNLSFADEVSMKNYAPATKIDVSFGGLKNTKFTYTDGLYTAEQYGQTLVDGNNNETLKFRNLVILFADHKVLDNEGRREVTLNTTGTGYFLCDGKMVSITWSRAGDAQPFEYFFEDGSPLTLGVGKSYIGIIPTGSTVTAE